MKTQNTLLALAILITSLSFGQNNTFPTTGNVGIGTTNPTSKLDVNGVIQAFNKDTNFATWDNVRIWAEGEGSFIESNGDENGLTIRSNTGNKILLMNNVGIGTTTPQAKLDLFSATAVNGPILSIRSDFTALGKYAMIRFGDQSQTSLYQKGAIIYEGVAGSARGQFHIALNNDDTFNSVTLEDAKLTVQSNGNVGIGTTSPTAKLETFNSTAGITSFKTLGVNGYLLVDNVGSGENYYNANKFHEFQIGGDSKMRILQNGNVGIGTTTPTAKLQVEGLIKSYVPAVLGANLNDFQLLDERAGFVTSNIIYNRLWTLRDGGPNNWYGARLHDGVSVDASFASPHIDTKTWWERDPNDNIQSWGNAGDTYLTINNGNVGIGSTIPDQKLTVKGKIHAEEIIVDLAVPADYVFQKYYTGKSELKSDYTLPTLAEIESFTKKNHHLPNVPSAQEVQQNGLSLGTMSNVLLQKVEELTLYAIEQNKELERLKIENENYKSLAERLSSLEKALKK